MALFLLVLGIELASYARGIAYNVWYNNAFLAGSALLLFSLFARIKNGLDYSAICWLREILLESICFIFLYLC